MTYQFARIDLHNTNYQPTVEHRLIQDFTADVLAQLHDIYRTYCIYKHFASVMPMFDSRFLDPMADVLAYYDQGRWVAWSLIRRYDDRNAMCDQFAWIYHNPRLRFGIETLKTECALYKSRGFRYLYLEQAHLYKHEIEGFEILGPMT